MKMKRLQTSYKLSKYFELRDKRTWFYWHLRRDEPFKKEAQELRAQLPIQLPTGTYMPTAMIDFELTNDPDVDHKRALIAAFMKRWNIHSEYALMKHLLTDDENDLPQMDKAGFALQTDLKAGMFHVDIPITVERIEFEALWLMVAGAKRDLGIDIAAKPKKGFDEKETRLAYDIWKMRRDGKTWSEVVKSLNRYNSGSDKVFDITAAQRLVKTHGFFL